MVYAFSMIRKWLRRMIGLDAMEARLNLADSRLTIFISRADGMLEAQRKRIDLIAYRRDIAHVPDPVLDWEAQQAAFLNNPENFKEENLNV
jgi:hypothetical protein